MTGSEPVLKACPFCGGEARHSLYIRDGGKVQCTNANCYANTFQFNPNGAQKAIAAWNTRASISEPVAPVRLLRVKADEQESGWAVPLTADELRSTADTIEELTGALRDARNILFSADPETIIRRVDAVLAKLETRNDAS